MKQIFYKYQGAGNDFVMIDNRQRDFDKNNTKHISSLCDRRFGIGGDGLILLENHDSADFKMVYYNADGNESSMCGNGGRCIVAFAKFLNIISDKAFFEAVDGLHRAEVKGEMIRLQMQDVKSVDVFDTHVFLNTGSPHHVQLIKDIDKFDVKSEGGKIRNSNAYKDGGTNVNFVEPKSEDHFMVRTYERGVEDETLACGTGVTAVALAMYHTHKTQSTNIHLRVKGGELNVSFDSTQNGYENIWLTGPAVQVFKGEL